jgi:hypothetical protein
LLVGAEIHHVGSLKLSAWYWIASKVEAYYFKPVCMTVREGEIAHQTIKGRDHRSSLGMNVRIKK